MFTGIIEEIGEVSAIENYQDALRMSVNAHEVLADVNIGDSIAVDGVCLTVSSFDQNQFTVDCMQETLDRTVLGTYRVSSRVNLERALAVQGRLGGHVVQGHVDATTVLLSREHSEHWDILRFNLPAHLSQYVVEKGSIAINGTSLTVSALGAEWFEVSLIPSTLENTTHGQLAAGDIVNIEVDILAKYVERMLLTHPSNQPDNSGRIS